MAPKLPPRYQTQVRLGRDGDVEEWLATDTALDRPVLIRSLDPSSTDRRQERYAAAVRDAARVSHIHLAKVYEVSAGDATYAVVEWNGGVSIADRLEAGDTLPVQEFLPNAAGLAEGLAALHASGTVHGAIDSGAVQFSAAHPAKLGAYGREPAGTSPADDTKALATTLRQALTGSTATELRPSQLVEGLPRSVDDALAAAEAGALDAAHLAAAMRAAPFHTDTAGDGAWSWRWLTPAGVLVAAAMVFGALGLTVDVDPDSPFLFPATPQEVVDRPAPQGTAAPPQDPATAETIPITARSYDPFGDNTENDASIPLIHDGDRTTTWSTERYFSPLTSLKPGVGVVFTPAAEPAAVIIIGGPGVSYEIGWASALPDDFAGWDMVATGTLGLAPVTVQLPSREQGVWLLWLTSLPDIGDGIHVGEIGDVSFTR
ncbi:MAG: hypothetical protein M3349_00585 [Actinomycetota bacterium]|nr:hypothetical protein [Actinomycetota bacterium]